MTGETVAAQDFFGPADGQNNEVINNQQQVLTADAFFGSDEPKVDPSPDPSFLERFNEDLKKRAHLSTVAITNSELGNQSYAEGLLQVAGQVGAGSILDFIGEAVKSGASTIGDLTPEVIKKPLVDGVTAAGHKLLNTDIGQAGLDAAKQGIDKWTEFEQQNPAMGRNIRAVVDLGMLLAPVKTKIKADPVSIKPTVLGKVGTVVTNAGREQKYARHLAFSEDLVSPKVTASVAKEQVGHTNVSRLGTKSVEPSAAEKEMATYVADVRGVNPNKTLQGNFNAISSEVRREADGLKNALKQNEVTFRRKEYTNQLDNVIARLEDHPLLVGDASKMATKIVKKMG